MIQTIVEYLNLRIATLGRIADLHGITERRKREGDGALVPYCYVGSGEFRPVELDNGNVGWWRGRSGFTMDPVQVIGRAVKQQRASYPLRFVAVLRRELSTSDDAFMPSRLAEDIANALNFDNGDIVSMLKAINVESRASGGEYDAATIWPTEFHTSIPDLRYDLAMVAIDVTIEVVGKYSCWEGECATDPDILRLFNFCDPSVIARLTDTQVTCLESAICEAPLPCADATVTVNTAPFGTAPSGGALDVPVVSSGDNPVGTINGGEVVIANTPVFANGTQIGDVESEQPFNFAIEQDGTPSGTWNAGTQTWEVTSSAITVSVSLSDTTPEFDSVVTVTATATGATSYTFYLPAYDGKMLPVTQASNVYLWTVKEVGNWTVRVSATDGSGTGYGTVSGSTVGDIHASAFIARHNTLSGATMNATYQTYVLGWFLRAKGVYATHAVDAFTPEIAAGGEAYLYIPVNSTTFSIPAFFINAFNPLEVATPVGFVGADASVNGLTGGVGKHALFNRAPSHFGQNTVGLDAYVRTSGGNVFHIGSAVGADGFGSVCMGIGLANTRQRHQANDTYNFGNYGADITGHISLRRRASTSRFSNMDGAPNMVLTTDALFGINVTSSAPTAIPYMGHACNGTAGSNRHSAASICFLSSTSQMDQARDMVWAEASIWLQTQFGRNV